MANSELRGTRVDGGPACRRTPVTFLLGAALAVGLLHAAPAAAQTTPAPSTKIQIRYETTEKHAAVRDLLARHKVLEKAQLFMSPLRLPRELTIRTADCGAPSVPYDAEKGVITICYEAIASVQELAKGATSDKDTLAALVAGGIIEETLHRIALAVIRVFDVPVWGREEDAADLLGAFIMIKFDERTARVAIIGASKLFVSNTSALGKLDYASDVSPSAQRSYNFLCIAYGGAPLDFQPIVDEGALPFPRAGRCGDEYNAIRKAFDLRLMPFVDPDLVVKIRAIDWLHEGD